MSWFLMQFSELANWSKSEKADMLSNRTTFRLSVFAVAVLLFGEIFSSSLPITGKNVMQFIIMLNMMANIARSPALVYMLRLTFDLYLVHSDSVVSRVFEFKLD